MANSQSIAPALPTNRNVRVYEFGIRVDKDALPAIQQQIALSRRLYNRQVERIGVIVNQMREFVIERAGDGARQSQERVDALSAAFADAKARDDEPAMKQIAADRRAAWADLSAALREARKEHRKEIQDRFLSKIGRNSQCDTYKLRCEAVADGLGWATANTVLENALIAFKKSFSLGKSPRFCAGDTKDQDTLTLQFTAAGGLPAHSVLSGSNLELSMQPPASGAGKRKYGEFKFRLGAASADNYATGTWQYHRALPDDSTISMARLVRRQIGKDWRWALQLVVKSEQREHVSNDREPLAAVHFGWASDVDGRRVAGVTDAADPSQARIISLPPDIETDLQRASEIQGERDASRDAIAPRLREIDIPEPTDSHEGLDASTPEGMAQRAAAELQAIRKLPAQHVAIRRLHRLCGLLRAVEKLPDWLEAWRKEDKMRWQASSHIARRARNRRKDFYRNFAAQLAKRYSAIVIEPLDLAAAAKKVDEETGEKSEFSKKARSGRVVAALYELESAIRWAATKHECAIFELSAATVSQCAHCGESGISPNSENMQELHCPHCGAVLDRKLNGAAVAWQIVSASREDLIEDFWLKSRQLEQEQLEKSAERKRKMAEGRKNGLRTPAVITTAEAEVRAA
ncbi:hypothetical protein [Uliginosibacterium sediminicola]|uniref:Transposase n=1 Tax=Uliginosibacterium sediminicola TaxID=2024550 RepID=A0ABU9YVW3_9RHOO